ncbi:hypothetical protein G5C51_33970 [Streptomyces sp. A7024]|uniref:DUF5709 domain-containing protein n=1 Tax=Streptomyces coryli TaxID=1128680 RepID=A0A6G4UBX5_9ACTN|nr:hypothetical protein [Streptomyces coryli]NGN68888.1 hypothetical protein [Streptomyces coryli]
MNTPHDPGTHPEDEGIPDLRDGSPAAEQAEDPQTMPVPGDEPVAAEGHTGTTAEEAADGAPLDERLAAEQPEPGAEADEPPDEQTGETPGDELDDLLGDLPDEPGDELPDEEAGLLVDDPNPGARLAEQDVFSHTDPAPGRSAEEQAVHTRGDDRDLGQGGPD